MPLVVELWLDGIVGEIETSRDVVLSFVLIVSVCCVGSLMLAAFEEVMETSEDVPVLSDDIFAEDGETVTASGDAELLTEVLDGSEVLEVFDVRLPVEVEAAVTGVLAENIV